MSGYVFTPMVITPMLWISIGIFYLNKWRKKKKHGYLKIEKRSLTVFHEKTQIVILNEILEIKKFAGDFIICLSDHKINIEISKINKDSIEKLNDFFRQLNLDNAET